MCHKTGDDGTGTYDYCTHHLDPRNPVICSNARIGTLICVDATENDGGRVLHRRQRLLERLKDYKGNRILCVPARFRATNPGSDLSTLPECWSIVATDKAFNVSFVADPTHQIRIKPTDPWANEVKLCPLSQEPDRE